MSEKIGSEAKPEASAAKPRGRPFEKGNPGRPPGSRNRTTRALEQMLEGQAEAITAKVVEMALAGNHVAMRLCMDRLISIPAERSISIELPRIESAKDCATAMSAIVSAVASGEITPNEGVALSALVTSTVRALEADEIERRLDALEKGETPP